MISVCIPVYNYDVLPLAESLHRQCSAVEGETELVFIDDGSDDEWRGRNATLAGYGTYVTLEHNVGRARVRNLFLQHARGEYLLFLDNDSQVPDGFLSRYAALEAERPDVVVGGRVYDRYSDRPECHLRYLYGVEAECRTAEQRRRQPYRSFMTCNFMVKREVLRRIPFDERLTRYGHEDTLFGFRLMQEGVPIVHIDNPVVNGDLEPNGVFLQKTGEAVQNLVQLYDMMAGDERFCRSVRLLDAYRTARKTHTTRLVHTAYRLLRRPLESHFIEGNAISVKQFSFYKLGLFIEKKHFINH